MPSFALFPNGHRLQLIPGKDGICKAANMVLGGLEITELEPVGLGCQLAEG